MTLFEADEDRVRPADVQAAVALGEVRAWDEVDCEPDDGPGLDWDDLDLPDEAPPSRRVVSIETTGERL